MRHNLLVTGGLGVVGEHVQAANIEDLVQLLGSGFVVGAGDGRGQLGSGRLIGEERLLRSAQVRSSGEGADGRQARRRAKLQAGAEEGGHCDRQMRGERTCRMELSQGGAQAQRNTQLENRDVGNATITQ